MRSMQIIEWGKPLELRCYETPTPSGDELLIKVESCGVCHSDLHIWEGFFDLGDGKKFPIKERGVKLPFTLGHEPVGTIIAKGNTANGDVGKSYAIYPWINCGKCEPCINGLTQICDSPEIIGTRVNGAYSDHVIVPNSKYLVDYSGISPDLACTLGCSGLTTFSAIKKINPEKLKSSDSVLILGAGGLGLTALCILKEMCKANIIVSDIDDEKRSAAKNLGADHVIDPSTNNALENVISFGSEDNKTGIACSLDFVGLPQTMAFATTALRKGGHHIHVGLFGGSHSISLPPLAFRMLRISGSYVGTLEEFKELVTLVRNGLNLPIPISTRPLEDAASALSDLQTGKIVGRMVLKP